MAGKGLNSLEIPGDGTVIFAGGGVRAIAEMVRLC